jgi:hypothetical protein
LTAALFGMVSGAAANITYNLNHTSGSLTVTGSIITDGTLGPLGAANLLEWNVTWSSPTVFGVASGGILVGGPFATCSPTGTCGMSASSTALTFTGGAHDSTQLDGVGGYALFDSGGVTLICDCESSRYSETSPYTIATTGSPVAETIVTVVEYYNATLDHYFITADSAEIAVLDGGGASGAWQRTGRSFKAWGANGGPTGSEQVCRFFGTDRYRADGTRIGPNSHFYTADPGECAFVRTAWQSLANDGQMYPAWTFESYAFRVIAPVNGVCPLGTSPLYRAYNNGALGDPNHRYSTILLLLQTMPGWTVEGVVMCLPGVSAGSGVDADSAECMVPVPGHSSVMQDVATGATQRHWVTGTTITPVVHVSTQTGNATVDDERNYSILAGSGTTKIVRFADYKTTLSLELSGVNVIIETTINDGQQLTLPMAPGETQSGSQSVSGNYAITTTALGSPATICTAPITGTIQWQWTYVGMESLTVPAGTFKACRFEYVRSESLGTTCPPGIAGGSASDAVTYWFAPDIGIVKAGGFEMISHSP